VGAQILADLGIRKMRLMTNNPKKMSGLASYGLTITEQLPITTQPNPHNRRYLQTKQKKLGHLLTFTDADGDKTN
jgi:3,4-dihydroxy 2-butanone 4-phosphate synthase/GTP cyclohydrolase II